MRVHVTVNTMPRNDEVARLPEHLERLNDAGVDALILADLGAFTLAGKYAPKCERHISHAAVDRKLRVRPRVVRFGRETSGAGKGS